MTRLLLAIVIALAFAADAALARAAPVPAGASLAAKPCAKEAKKVRTFKKGMPAKKRRFFRTHGSAKARKRFVRQQAKRLEALRRAHRRCLRSQAPPPQSSPPAPLPGPPRNLALDAVADVITDDALVTDAEVTDGVVRTQIELAFRKDASVEEVNALLSRIGGRIVSSRAGVLIAVVEIPDPGSLAALDQLLASLAGDLALRQAAPVFMPPPDELPEHIAYTAPADLDFVRSQLAVRGHAAWNAKAALDGRTPPTLVVGDYFGDGPPGAGTDIGIVAGDFAANDRTSDHGYMVLGIAAGAYDGVGAGSVAAEGVTGVFPARLPVRAADIHTGLAGAVLHDRLLELIENAPGDVVVNTSLGGWPCVTVEEQQAYCTVAFASAAAERWIERVRGTDPSGPGVNLESKFVHATSAGNVDGPGPVGARLNSEWAAAALLSPLSVPNLTNTLVVENFTATSTGPFRPGCAAASSELGGTVAGVGSPVHSFEAPSAATTLADGGTSAATPQVAALAAYVWALRPGLTPPQVVSLIERTARQTACGGGGSVIDAYAAVLATDGGNPGRPVRRAVLDVADSAGEAGANGQFDAHDLDEILAGFESLDGAIDYGRFDLNGDGVTRDEPGVTRVDRVDLDADEELGEAAEAVEGPVVHFDERSLSDENVLCYAAYSPLWQGTAQERRDRLGLDQCAAPRLSHTFPGQVRAGETNTLTISADSLAIADEQGDPMPIEDVHVLVTPQPGATVLGPASGPTNADGVFVTSARLDQGQQLTLDVQAFDRQGGALVAEDTVTATLVTAGTVQIDGIFAHISVRAGSDDGDDEATSGSWTMSGAAGGGGGTASVGASSTLAEDDGTFTYEGSGTLSASAGSDPLGAVAGVDHQFEVTVSGGEVRWQVIQRAEGLLLHGGCQVNGQPFPSRSGLLEPGQHVITFDCGGGAAPGDPELEATYSWRFTIGPG